MACSRSGAVLLKAGEVGVPSGQQSDGLRAALVDVRDRAVAAVSRQMEAKEQAARHRQKRDKTVQASNLLKVCTPVRVVCVTLQVSYVPLHVHVLCRSGIRHSCLG